MNLHFTRTTLATAVVSVAALGGTGAGTAVAATATSTDKAFVREMVPHHMMAVEMASMAKMQGEHKQIRSLAVRVISAQDAEITRMKGIAKTLGVTPQTMGDGGQMTDQTMMDLETLKVSMSKSGMTMKMSELDGAKPFDRKFIDMMIPHHQGAIRMARAELARGKNAKLRSIAKNIISDQAKEIRQMNAWRKAWYGSASPAGGVPAS
jgi:uncharacterized protein (DUF305 family)